MSLKEIVFKKSICTYTNDLENYLKNPIKIGDVVKIPPLHNASKKTFRRALRKLKPVEANAYFPGPKGIITYVQYYKV